MQTIEFPRLSTMGIIHFERSSSQPYSENIINSKARKLITQVAFVLSEKKLTVGLLRVLASLNECMVTYGLDAVIGMVIMAAASLSHLGVKRKRGKQVRQRTQITKKKSRTSVTSSSCGGLDSTVASRIDRLRPQR